MRQSRNSLRLEDISKISAGIREFFETTEIPRLDERILLDVVVSVQNPREWFIQRQTNRLAVPADDEEEEAEVDTVDDDAEQREEEEGVDNDDILNHEARLKQKQYLTEGLYYTQRSKPKRAFPLPMNKELDKPRDFTLPYDIYCPTDAVKKVPNWRPLKKSRWIDVSSPKRQLQQKPMCNCTTRCAEDCINRLLQFECDATCCPFGKENCGNRALQTLSQQQRAGKRYATGYEIMWTKKKGYGLRATRAYSPGELIVEYTGDVVSQGEMKRRLNEDYSNLKNFYFLSLEKGHVIDSSVRGSEARFVNHSCSPNAEMQKWFVKDKPRVGLFAKTAIPAGIEITYDYNFNWFPGAIAQKCYCGSKNCRGYISKKTYTNPSSSSPDSAEPDDQPAVTSTNTTRRRAARESEPLPPPKQTRSRARKSLPANFEVSSRISSLRNRSELEEEGDDEDEEEEGEEGEDEEEDEVLERETNKAAETLIVKKRGPGRPRKYPRKEAAEEPIVMPENYDEQGMIDEEQPNGYIETNPVPTAFEFDSDSEGAPGVLPPTKHASSTLHSSKNSTSAFQRFALDSVNGMVENGSQSKPLQSPRRKIKRVADLLNEDETFVSVRKRGPGRPPKRPRVSFIPGDKPQTDGVLIDLSGDTVKVNTNTNTNGYINGDHQPNGRYERTTSSGNSALKENIVNQGHNKTEHALVPNGSLSNVANDKPYDLPTLTPGSIGKKPPYFVKLRASEIPTNGNSDEDKPSEPRKRLVRQIGSGRQLKPLPDVIFNSRGVTDLVNSIYTLAS